MSFWKGFAKQFKADLKRNISRNPFSDFDRQARTGMSSAVKKEHKRLSASLPDSASADLTDVDLINMSRQRVAASRPARPVTYSKYKPGAKARQAVSPNVAQQITKAAAPRGSRKLPSWQQRQYGRGRGGTLLTRGIADEALAIGRSLLGGL